MPPTATEEMEAQRKECAISCAELFVSTAHCNAEMAKTQLKGTPTRLVIQTVAAIVLPLISFVFLYGSFYGEMSAVKKSVDKLVEIHLVADPKIGKAFK
jgi:hypothetical protein